MRAIDVLVKSVQSLRDRVVELEGKQDKVLSTLSALAAHQAEVRGLRVEDCVSLPATLHIPEGDTQATLLPVLDRKVGGAVALSGADGRAVSVFGPFVETPLGEAYAHVGVMLEDGEGVLKQHFGYVHTKYIAM